MSARASPEVIYTRRLFARFLLLVVLPALGLVAFGVLAITNERAAVEQRIAAEYGGRLRVLAEHLVTVIEEVADRLPEQPGSLVRAVFIEENGRLVAAPTLDPEVTTNLLATLRSTTPEASGRAAFIPVRQGPMRGIFAVRRGEGRLHAVAFSDAALAELVEREAAARFPADRTGFSLVGPREAESSSNLRRLIEQFTAERHEAGFTALPLPAPLSDWRIVATLSDADPVRRALWRNRTVYIVVLSVFYVAIAIGVVLTLRGIRREANLSRLKTDFVSNVSHELRTPLTSIRLFAETLQMNRARTEEERAACVDFIVKESSRLAELTERSLEWARLEAGRRRFDKQPIEVAALVDEVLTMFFAHHEISRSAVWVEVPPDVPTVEGDASALGQVLLNLLENAVKYTGENRRIVVRVRVLKRKVRIEVIDNGIGIARQDRRRIFERFYRADDLLARRTEGTGLGLSIARRIVDAHGGRLIVDSRLNEGSRFTVELPVPRRSS